MELVAPARDREYNSPRMTANELFAAISPALATRIIDEVHGTDKDLYRVAVGATAQVRKVRPVFLERQPRADRHRTMATAMARPEMQMIAGNVLSGWLVKNQKAILVDFLDALKIEHKEGVVDELPAQVDDAALISAINMLLGKYEREVVALYLHAFHGMNEANWPNLTKIFDEDERLLLGAGYV
ncbi:MAG TPA: hypothetical protein VK530_10540 [Candidatus Acidoferrum sp.]|nr:hypothetical protein [Candidatus Acidoferrum sp.]